MKESFGFDIDPKEWEEVIRMAKDLPAKIGQEAFGSTLDDGIEDRKSTRLNSSHLQTR